MSTADPKSTLPGSVMTGTVTINTNLTPRSNNLELISRDYKENTDTFSTTATGESSTSTNYQTSVPGSRYGTISPAVPVKSNIEVINSSVFLTEKSGISQI